MARDKKLIIGNWKMNLNVHESSLYLHKLAERVKIRRSVDVVLAPTMLALQTLSLQINHRQFKLASQNLYWRDKGAFTGEVSATQLRGIVSYSIIGHSERRNVFNESDKDTRAKVQAAIRNGIKPVLCVGETTSERAAGEAKDVIHDQLLGGLANVTTDELEDVIIAYEPVWAIGTGNNASVSDVTEGIIAIRSQLKHLYGAKIANQVRVLYGGSVTAETASDYLILPEVDGLLIGGASLNADAFASIVEQANKSVKKAA